MKKKVGKGVYLWDLVGFYFVIVLYFIMEGNRVIVIGEFKKNKEEFYGFEVFYLNCKGNRLVKLCLVFWCVLVDFRLIVKLY